MKQQLFLQQQLNTVGLIGHWKLWDGTTFDYSLRGHLGTPENAVDYKFPGIDFGGTNAIQITDHAEFSFGNGTVDSPFSIGAWVFVTVTGTLQTIISKKDTNGREWDFNITSEKVRFILTDESAGVSALKESDAALATSWHFVVCTYIGQSTAGATAGNLITLYVDGVVVDSTTTNNGAYDAIEDLTEDVVIGARNPTTGLDLFFQDKLDNIMIFNKVLTITEIKSIYETTRGRYSV